MEELARSELWWKGPSRLREVNSLWNCSHNLEAGRPHPMATSYSTSTKVPRIEVTLTASTESPQRVWDLLLNILLSANCFVFLYTF